MTQARDTATRRQSALICLGSNLPVGEAGPEKIVQNAVAEIGRVVGVVVGESRLFTTPCWPPGAGPDYVNAAVRCETGLAAGDVLAALHGIEAAQGRTRRARWEARVLDLDLIALGDLVCPDAETQSRWRDLPVEEQAKVAPDGLVLPHPRMAERAFVLVPLAEVAPDWRHPLTGQSVLEMLDALPEAARGEIRAL
ncbi:2-amino-4-hydroxy-6-hydroxymethyldihydropteridine diphosphokinase [Aestuariibius sp. 2305UL40-4]|uniref:2-amino-4-hydroxy-6- hydroxymethyldihydropteridine diphosphokinase n=1 Tax=Aestuariibius violaceus TaxID=3234132 RepID=UPI00345E2FEB